ncbi:MAG: hypothetical protein EA397_20250 [Deltaproteobacteria bacterium]|nr:MAG: hypothetical protein EA397_20250 [Deltaproteobacteria bacterium]
MTPLRLTLFELNEFNLSLLERAVAELKLSAVARLMELPRFQTTTSDSYEDRSLEPWVQWVSIHTGVPSQVHGVRHIGDLPPQDRPQLWEVLADRGVSTGVWGVLNGARRQASSCRFFVPDPWTFSERAEPRELDDLIALPRFLAKNRLNLAQPRAVMDAARLARAFRHPRDLLPLVMQAKRAAVHVPRGGRRAYTWFTPFEYLSAKRFVEWKKRTDPAFCLLFVNMLAHAQHYYWRNGGHIGAELTYVLRYVDRVAALVLESLRPGEELIVANGFEQFQLPSDHDHHVYRPRDHARLLALVGLEPLEVDAHMTNDAYLRFADPDEAERAAGVLAMAQVRHQPLFDVHRDSQREDRLFYQVKVGQTLNERATFTLGGQEHPFWDHFDSLGTHTGRHGTRGDVLTTLEPPGNTIKNHELFNWILERFEQPTAKAKARGVDKPLSVEPSRSGSFREGA